MGATSSTAYDAVAVPAPDSQTKGQFGYYGMKLAGDLNHDGVQDLWVSSASIDVGGLASAGRVYAIDGRTRQVLYHIDYPEPQATKAFGHALATIGDLNGDGIAELAVGAAPDGGAQDVGTGCGTPKPNGCHENQGRVWIFDGATGALRSHLDNPFPQGSLTNTSDFGYAIASTGDVTGNGHPDIIVGAPQNDRPADCASQSPPPAGCSADEGQAFIFDGVTGALVRTLNLPSADRQPPGGCASVGCGFGYSVLSPGDVNGDGVADQLISAPGASAYSGSGSPCGTPKPNGCNDGQGRMYLFDGATGNLIRRIDTPFPGTNIFFGFQDDLSGTPGDVTGDGVPDIYGAVSEEGAFQGQGYVFNGATGAFLYGLKRPGAEVGDAFYSIAKTDYNKDGTPDLFAGVGSYSSIPTDQNGGAYIFNGKDGSVLKSFELPQADRQGANSSADYGPFLGFTVASPGDLNGDGEPDYVASAPFYNEGAAVDAGRLYFFLSRVPGGQPTTPQPTTPQPTTPSGGFAGKTAPGVTNYGLTNNPFVVSGSKTPTFGFAAKSRKHKKGTTFRYTLSEAATVQIVISQRRSGRRRGKKCVAPTRSLRKAKKCTRTVSRGTLTRTSHVGKNSVGFSGRIGSKKLSPGSYLATLIATDAAKNASKPRTISFTIVKR
ncbi:MAG: FG-GAP-like repeat-containing protein [Actinomycetota bacterium]|nr:FG-GAP-like repeat-containing protein [Actinomycetota bacterium]